MYLLMRLLSQKFQLSTKLIGSVMKTEFAEILFISDLHLSAERPAIIELFNRFIKERAIDAQALYILGDFFEYWLGDDDPAENFESIFESFKLLHQNNVPVFFMHGNRDFLVQQEFADRTHCQLISDPENILIDHTQITLMHGDSLCTDDTEYQQFKRKVRHSEWINSFLQKPLEERKQIVETLRRASQSETAMKQESIMDVNKQAVLDAFKQYNSRWIIHGHTHRPKIHHYNENGHTLTRIVLGDWHDHGSVLSIKTRPELDFDVALEAFH